MGLFGSETYRSFAIGFGLGAVALFGALAVQGDVSFSAKLVPTAQAAAPLPDNTLASIEQAR